MDRDVTIVGGGIAGSALATVLAREGLDVVVLERQERFADRVRGENLHPWGVAEARRLGLEDVLLAAGGHLVSQFVNYGDREDAPPTEVPVAALVEDVPGELNLGHPAACEALATEAVTQGVTFVRGVDDVEVTAGTPPGVAYGLDGERHEVTSGLVVGADGRASPVRRQLGIELEHAPETHMIAGLLIEDLDADDDKNVLGIGDDVFMITFPQGGGRARVYLCPGVDDRRRFAGPDGPERFLRAAAVDAVPGGEAWSAATPAGPCRTYPADDTWTERPFAEGVVLLGDAAGHNNPLIGQGLGLALRDVRALAELLLEGGATGNGATLGTDALTHYGTERAERLRRMRFVAQLYATVATTFGSEGREMRQRWAQRLDEQPELMAPLFAIFMGPEQLDPAVCTDEFRRRFLGPDAA